MESSHLDIIHVPSFFSKEESDVLFETIKSNIFLNGQMNTDPKVLTMPRLIKWFGDKAYAYSSIYHPAQAIPDYILEKMHVINSFLKEQNVDSMMNSVLINYYRDGRDKINYHSDDKTQIGELPVISSVSLGDSRVFKFRHKVTKEKRDFVLNHGDLIIMKGDTQDIWQHGVLPEENKKDRINLTFRNTKYEPNFVK